jgi:hypothetical protein
MSAKALRRFHLARALFWVALAPVVLLTSLKDAVWLVLLLSLYANFIGDVDAWQASRAEEKSE